MFWLFWMSGTTSGFSVVGITSLLKLIYVLRQPLYGVPAYFSDDLFDILDSTTDLCLQHFCSGLKAAFGAVHLREPTVAYTTKINAVFRAAGSTRCIVCLERTSWAWHNIPKALQGIMVGKDGQADLRMRAICSFDLWIFSFQFGLPGAITDLNISDFSNHFSLVLGG